MVSKADERWDEVGDNPFVIIDAIRKHMSEAKEREEWADELSQFIEDEDVDKVMDLVIQMIDGVVPEASKIGVICVRLEAFALKFRTRYSAYMSYKKGTTEANMRKNHYKEIYVGLDRLVDALKYLAK